ncbi:MAG TPA: HAD hydrolase-like protein [Firmicutes bacterium]|jgi:putative hydrolase of the HAD superfamily|nr:HAD hydrolase-like protein [Bacillota bacterium]
MKAVLFDLDDTLYPEITFVKSGFKAVASYLRLQCKNLGYGEQDIFDKLMQYLKIYGRGKVFDYFLNGFDLDVEYYVPLLVHAYRTHALDISLYPGAATVLQNLRCRGFALGIITDGMASVQKRKLEALGLKKMVDVIICTDEIGKDFWKPSTIPYKIALDYLNVRPGRAIYVGNDITKDFIGARAINMHTVQIKHKNVAAQDEEGIGDAYKADYVIHALGEIYEILNCLKLDM